MAVNAKAVRGHGRRAIPDMKAAEVVAATSYAFAGRKVSPADHLAAVTRLLPVAQAIVEKYGGHGVPVAVLNESIVRLIGYFLEGRFGAFTGTGVQIPPQSHAAAFRNSGAQSLVSPWKIRRAGAI